MGSIKFKVLAIIAIFLLLIGGIIGTTFYIAYLQSADAKIIDIAGRQRMLTQKITKESLALLAIEKVDINKQKETIMKTVSLYDRSLQALKDGGSTMGTDNKETMLPPAMEN